MDTNGNRVYSCDDCTFDSLFLTDLWKHKLSSHAQDIVNDNPTKKSLTDFVLNTLAEQNADIMGVVFEMNQSLRGAFQQMANGMQDNFDSLEEENRKKNDNLKAVIATLSDKVARIEAVQSQRLHQVSSGPSVPQPFGKPKSKTTPPPPPSPIHSTPAAPKASRKKPKTQFLKKPRLLYVGDSIAHNVAKKYIEDKIESRMVSKKAYSSTYDKRAKWPAKNVNDVTKKALREAPKDDKYEYIVLSAPTVDITNLDTSKTKPSDNMEIFKQDVPISCKNMFTVAQNAINAHKEIKKVVLIEHPARFDTDQQDPLSIKAELAKYANGVCRQLWFESNLKHKIVLGQHKLDCSEKIRLERFTDRSNNKYDGVHMYGELGRRAYTDSVVSILVPGLHLQTTSSDKSCPQTRYKESQKNNQDNRYSVPIKNRFNPLGN